MNKWILFSAMLITGVVLAGCQATNSGENAGSNSSKSTASVTNNLRRFANKSYSGIYRGKGTPSDPTYKYEISFDKSGKFVQKIISSKGYAARFIEQGTYKYDTNKHEIKLVVTDATEARYTSDTDLKNSGSPTMLSTRSRKGQSKQTQLTKAESRPLIIKDKGHYLLGTVNNVKLYADKSFVRGDDYTVKQEIKDYSSLSQAVNQKTFYAKLGTSRIWLSFNDDGVWNCRIIDGTHKWDIYDQGTWSIRDSQLNLKTTGDIREYTIVGDTSDPSEYSGVTTNSSRVTDNFNWRIKGNDLVITSKQDASMSKVMQVNSTTVTPTFTKAQTATKNNDKVMGIDPFSSEDAFLSWMKSNSSATVTDFEIPDDSQFKRYENVFAENFYGVKAVYILTSETNNYDVPSMIVFANDGNVYGRVNNIWSVDNGLTAQLPIVKEKNNISSSNKDSTNTSALKFHSKEEFGDWLTHEKGLDEPDSKYEFEVADGDNNEDFSDDVSGVKPLYYAGERHIGTKSNGKPYKPGRGGELVYGDDGNIYSHANENNPDKWQIDGWETDKLFGRNPN